MPGSGRVGLHLLEQERSAWTHELDIRPDVETFCRLDCERPQAGLGLVSAAFFS